MPDRVDRRTFLRRHTTALVVGSVFAAIGGSSYFAEEMIRLNADADGIREATEKGTPEQNAILQKRGLLGEHELIDLRDVAGFNINGNISGGFLVFSGSFNGRSTELLQFAWKTNTEPPLIIISDLPTDQIIIKNPTDNQPQYPTINFDFVMRKILTYQPNGSFGIHSTAFDSDNPNDFLTDGKVRRANITMTTEQLKKFRSSS